MPYKDSAYFCSMAELELVFWGMLGLLLFIYLGYGFAMALVSKFVQPFPKSWASTHGLPSV